MRFQRIADLSELVVMSVRPSGMNAIDVTSLVWPKRGLAAWLRPIGTDIPQRDKITGDGQAPTVRGERELLDLDVLKGGGCRERAGSFRVRDVPKLHPRATTGREGTSVGGDAERGDDGGSLLVHESPAKLPRVLGVRESSHAASVLGLD